MARTSKPVDVGTAGLIRAAVSPRYLSISDDQYKKRNALKKTFVVKVAFSERAPSHFSAVRTWALESLRVRNSRGRGRLQGPRWYG